MRKNKDFCLYEPHGNIIVSFTWYMIRSGRWTVIQIWSLVFTQIFNSFPLLSNKSSQDIPSFVFIYFLQSKRRQSYEYMATMCFMELFRWKNCQIYKGATFISFFLHVLLWPMQMTSTMITSFAVQNQTLLPNMSNNMLV